MMAKSNLIKALKTPAHELFKLKHFCSSLGKVHSFQIKILVYGVEMFRFYFFKYSQVLVCETAAKQLALFTNLLANFKKQLSRGDWSGSVRTYANIYLFYQRLLYFRIIRCNLKRFLPNKIHTVNALKSTCSLFTSEKTLQNADGIWHVASLSKSTYFVFNIHY